ncbi:hypothetical protein [Paracidovorax avenae]|uniref:hypothetical protein n=1 Tax=Paracidovorax avenae TaxID=80867 RepID=UPI000D21229F|nr:hypothetical protein [Paracidovorax avenae]AVT13310.1 hypothetical protein C8235_10755 [Paracidovorax avenae]
MPFFRSALAVRRFVLACFLWAIAVSGASPLVLSAAPLDRICSAEGTAQWSAVPPADQGQPAPQPHAHALDCPACLPTGLAPPAVVADALPHAPLPGARPSGRQNPHPACPAAGHLPARGPPGCPRSGA